MGSMAIVIVSNNDVSVTATVLSTLSFSLSGNSTDFGTLLASTVATSTSSITLTISTNSTDGYIVTVKDAYGGLNCLATSHLIASATATLSTGTEGYGIQASGTGATIATAYNKTGNDVGSLQTTAQTLASNTGPANANTVIVTHKAAISNITNAGDYIDTITYNIIGNF
jgi:hypothetical protein